MYHLICPSRAPGFAYSWLELISHRVFIAKLLLHTPQQKVRGEEGGREEIVAGEAGGLAEGGKDGRGKLIG